MSIGNSQAFTKSHTLSTSRNNPINLHLGKDTLTERRDTATADGILLEP